MPNNPTYAESERFSPTADEMNNRLRCVVGERVYDIRYNEQYFFQFGRLSLNGTYWAEYWDSQVDFKMGLHIDLFIFHPLV